MSTMTQRQRAIARLPAHSTAECATRGIGCPKGTRAIASASPIHLVIVSPRDTNRAAAGAAAGYRRAAGAATLAEMTRGFRFSLRTLAIAATVLISGGFPSHAQMQSEQQNQQWCAYFTGAPTNCSFATFEECLAAIRGKTALCDRNQRAGSTRPRATDRPNRSH